MNQIQHIKRINEQELESGSSASWHDQYKDSAYINVGGLPYNLTEGDVITIFSQYGEIADINMPRDPQTGKPRGFAWLMYMDQRSTVLAVDNLNGAQVLGRMLRVDHVKDYKQLERDQETGKMREREERSLAAHPEKFLNRATSDASDAESDDSHPSIDLDDPMRDYLIEQKRAASKSKKRRIEVGEGESKEERKRRREEKRREKEERRRAREERRREGKEGRRAIEGGGGREDGARDRDRRRADDDRALPSSSTSRREDDRRREYSPRRGGGGGGQERARDRDRRRDYSPPPPPPSRRDDYDRRRGGDDYDDRRRRDDRDRDYRRRDDERDERRGGGGGRSGGGGGGGDAFADLEKWVRG